jgi:hypothetical protein
MARMMSLTKQAVYVGAVVSGRPSSTSNSATE